MNQVKSKNPLRSTVLVVVCLAISAIIAIAVAELPPSREAPDAIDELAARVSAMKYPNRGLSPEDVVRIQLDACADQDWGRGSLQCFCFASPANRAVTGPVDRFGQMLRLSPYDVLSRPDCVLIGRPKRADGTTRILVTVAKDREILAFVWILAKQSEPPFVGCWMTEGVFAVESWRDDRDSSESFDKFKSIDV